MYQQSPPNITAKRPMKISLRYGISGRKGLNIHIKKTYATYPAAISVYRTFRRHNHLIIE